MDPFRRSLVLAPLALAVAGGPAFAAPVSLADLSRYLNGLTTAETSFVQVNADGSRSTGRVIIKRPNRMRFEYDPPNEAVVLASAGKVAIFDDKSNQGPEEYPIRRTPLSLILDRNIDLTRARMVVAHEQQGDETVVVAQDPDHPEVGTISLVFSNRPVALVRWVVTDEMGFETTVVLGDLRTGGDYPPSTFSIVMETERRR